MKRSHRWAARVLGMLGTIVVIGGSAGSPLAAQAKKILEAVPPRTITLVGFTASGTSVAVAPRTIILAGFTASGTSVAVAPRTIMLVGFTASGTSVAVAPRTITLTGWAGVGQTNP